MDFPLDIVDVGDDCFVINHGGSTVALISQHGIIDWLLRRPDQDGPLYTELDCPPDPDHITGLRLQLTPANPEVQLRIFDYDYGPHQQSVILSGAGQSSDGEWSATTEATLELGEQGEYVWRCRTTLRCQSHDPVELSQIEYNSLYPGRCGCGFLNAPTKEYHSTLVLDRNDNVWVCPHQHLMPYADKLDILHFGSGTWAGFFGEQSGSPVCIVEDATLPPSWGICDRHFALRSLLRAHHPIQPDEAIHVQYTIRYFGPIEIADVLRRARPIPVQDKDRQRWQAPRLELGQNAFETGIDIDAFDDASFFRPDPPNLTWDRKVELKGRGALRLHHEEDRELVWTAEPPTQIPAGCELRVSALAKTRFCGGRGFLIRLRYHTVGWHPQPKIQWIETYESDPLLGNSDDWVRIELPPLVVPPNQDGYRICLEAVLDGPGTAWLTDCNVELTPSEPPRS